MPAKKVLFISGKGGAGKTSLALATFKYLVVKGKKVRFFDFDVECPNAKLFFPNKRFVEKKDIFAYTAKINPKKCTNCGKCFSVCMFGSIIPSKNHFKVMSDSCKGCFACSLICPNNAIEKEKRKIGDVETYSVFEDCDLISGSLMPGEEDSMKIIDEMLKKTQELRDADYLIFDAEAGIKCPVLKLIENADMIFIVVEHSKFGIVDGLRALSAVEHLSKKCYVVLNKYRHDLNLDISEFSSKPNILGVFKVDFDKELLENYSKGEIKACGKEKMPFLEVFS